MITCQFEDGGKASLRHVVVHGICEKDGEILLVKRAPRLLEGGKWSIPAGFLNRNETAVECIEREFLEETGWKVTVKFLFRINTQPNRPHEDRQNVSLEYIVYPLEKIGIPDDENTEIAFVPIEKLPPFDTLAFDHGESLRLYLKYRKKSFTVPLID
jgi:8-oxo-dGTP diphosphatase